MDNKQPLKRFANRDRIADIAQAKRTAEKFGYRVELDTEDDAEKVSQIKRPFRHAYKAANSQTAKPAAAAKPATPQSDDLTAALRAATDAGYSVRKMTDFELAKDTAERHGYNVIKKQDPGAAPAAPTPAETAPAEKPDPYLARAQYFMYDEEN